MKLPTNMSEAEVLATIRKVVNTLAPNFVFGPYDLDDIKQEATLIALQGLEFYDSRRPLENFLMVRVRRRLINFRRDKLHRNDPPCRTCAAGGFCTGAQPRAHCAAFAAWLKRNTAKSRLMCPTHFDSHQDDCLRQDSTVVDDAHLREVLRAIDAHLPVELRGDYLRMREGAPVSAAQRARVREAVREIVGDAATTEN